MSFPVVTLTVWKTFPAENIMPNLIDERDAQLIAWFQQGKTNNEVLYTPIGTDVLEIRRYWLNTDSANTYIEFMSSLATKYNGVLQTNEIEQ